MKVVNFSQTHSYIPYDLVRNAYHKDLDIKCDWCYFYFQCLLS